MQQEFPKELLDKLNDFTLNFISEKFIDAVTYGLFFSTESQVITKCDEIFMETNDYFGESGVMRKTEVCNGVVYDIDMSIVGYIMKRLLDEPDDKDSRGYEELIGNSPETRRKKDTEKLAKLCLQNFHKQKRRFEVALYSISPTPNILVTGYTSEQKMAALYYPAFALRQWDVDEINKSYLVPNGCRISTMEICDILPARNGVRFVLHMTEV